MLALGMLEIGFIILVSTMTALAGLFAIYVVVQVFRSPSRRGRRGMPSR